MNKHPWYSPTLTAAGPHISVWLRLTKELCVPTGWHARFAQNAAYLHTAKANIKIGSALLLVSLCLFLSWCSPWLLITIAVIAVSVYCWFTLWSLPRQRQSLLWKAQPSVFIFGYRHFWKQPRVLVQKEHFWNTWKARRTLYPCSVSGKSTCKADCIVTISS